MTITSEQLTDIRSMVMKEYWRLVKTGLDHKRARNEACKAVAYAFDLTVGEIEQAWSADMRKRQEQRSSTPKVAQREAELKFVPDDPVLEFYDDLQEDTPKERMFRMRDQLRDMEVNKARACLFDDMQTAKDYKSMVAAAVRALGWKHNRKNPGYFAEILPVGHKFKLRVKRLR